MPGMPDTDAVLEAHLDATHAARLESYKAFLRIPSISALPEHADDCRRAAEWLADALAEAGLEHVEVAETGGHPVVYADWLHATDAPTVLVYGHYDVQPVDPLDLWTSPPFEPVVVDDRMLARGSADDKGQIHAHLMAAGGPAGDSRAAAGQPQVPVRGRGGIELGASRRVARGRARAARRRRRDHQRHGLLRRQPCRPSRSACAGSCTPRSTSSGRTSTSIRAATAASSRTRPTRWRRSSRRSRVPTGGSGSRASTTTSCRCPTPTARRSRRCRSTKRPISSEHGLPALVGEVGYSTLERRGTRPTLDVNGLWGGFQGDGSKTIIPAHAHAKVSCRLVAAQDPDRIFEAFKAYVEEIAPPGVTTTVRLLGGGLPSLTPMDHPATQAAARALEATFGRAPVYIREGGSIPVCAELQLDPRPAGRAPRVRPAGLRTRTRPTSGWTSATTRRASGRSREPGTSWSTCRAEGRPVCAEMVRSAR